MRRITLLLLVGLFAAAALVACSSDPEGPAGTASEIADKIFEESGVQPFGMVDTIDTDDKMTFYLGSTNYSGLAESAVVLPMINIDTRALYILKASELDSVDTILAQLELDVDPNKLVCVSFAHEDVVIQARGEVIFMTINSNAEQRDALVTAFTGLE
jgi:hypothetical protein